jgi:hypothetical protein
MQINNIAYLSSNYHVELTCERPVNVKKEVNTIGSDKIKKSFSIRVQVRKATSAPMKAKKQVNDGAAKKQ